MTHGLGLRPFATALRAMRPAAIMTEGFEVLVHEVIEAIATSPFWMSKSPRKSVETCTGLPFVFSVT